MNIGLGLNLYFKILKFIYILKKIV